MSNYKLFISFTICCFNILFIVCNERITNSENNKNLTDSVLVQTIGATNRFEVATWNIENFPKQGKSTIDAVSTIIKNLDLDLIAVQEIANITAFDSLLSTLPSWSGKLTDHVYNSNEYQKTGFLFKTNFISLSNVKSLDINEYTAYGSAFPRPPLAGFVQIIDNSDVKFDFNIIVLHMKAYGGLDNEARRRRACELLKNYIDEEIASGSDPDFIILGDWNDSLDDISSENVFNPFLDDTDNYSFLTHNLTNQYSYISDRYKSFIDHILITQDTKSEYGEGKTKVLYLDDQYSAYPSTVSDHRPVVSKFSGFNLELNN